MQPALPVTSLAGGHDSEGRGSLADVTRASRTPTWSLPCSAEKLKKKLYNCQLAQVSEIACKYDIRNKTWY